MSEPMLGVVMLCLLCIAIMIGFPTAFTLMALGVFFGCPSCNARFSMVTNPGETQMVSSLGVKLGGRTEAAEPFEMTRGAL